LHDASDPEALPPVVQTIDNPLADYRAPAKRNVLVAWTRVSAPVGLWWAFYVLNAVGSRFLVGTNVDKNMPAMIETSWKSAVLAGVGVASDLLALWLVRAIDLRTLELARRRAAYREPA